MTHNELYLFLYDWAAFVLDPNTTGVPPIVQSNEDSGAPDQLYLTIQYNGTRKKIGRANIHDPDEITGIRTQVNDWEVLVNIWETNGDGDLIDALIN